MNLVDLVVHSESNRIHHSLLKGKKIWFCWGSHRFPFVICPLRKYSPCKPSALVRTSGLEIVDVNSSSHSKGTLLTPFVLPQFGGDYPRRGSNKLLFGARLLASIDRKPRGPRKRNRREILRMKKTQFEGLKKFPPFALQRGADQHGSHKSSDHANLGVAMNSALIHVGLKQGTISRSVDEVECLGNTECPTHPSHPHLPANGLIRQVYICPTWLLWLASPNRRPNPINSLQGAYPLFRGLLRGAGPAILLRPSHNPSRYWKKTMRTKRKSQKMPMACQYQAAQSTAIWRISTLRKRNMAMRATTSAAIPRSRWTPWVPVTR
jgi:hypothetical protein